MILLLSTFGVCCISALVPLVNAEAYLAGIGVIVDSGDVWALSVVAALGQMTGKAVWYQVGRSSLQWPWVRRKTQSARWQQRYQAWQDRTQGHPGLTGLLLFTSAIVGLPPFALVSVLAGQLRVPFGLFLITGLVGRTARFATILGGMTALIDHGVIT